MLLKALEEAKALPLEGPTSLGADRSLKISGISALLGSVLEQQERAGAAYQVYADAQQNLLEEASEGPIRMRAIALAQKAGEMALSVGSKAMAAKAEEHLSWAVSDLLRLSTSEKQRQDAIASSLKGDSGLTAHELELPAWISKTDLGASMENLGNLYLAQGNLEYVLCCIISLHV